MRRGLMILAAACPAALAQPGADGIDWVTITHAGNPAYSGPDPEGLVAGRGSVPYEYRIGRYEITSAQWAQYLNTFTARSDPMNPQQVGYPTWWGGAPDPGYHGPGTRYITPGALANWPVAGLSWRECAMYVNWLCNNKSADFSARLSGAYDASTFGYDSQGIFTDQLAHTPGAPYWIPTLDEWMKAAHWDPANPNMDGWWMYPTIADTPPDYGPPPGFPNGDPAHQANAGFAIGQGGHWSIPLGSYPNATSPWGLLDCAGAASEWTESVFAPGTIYQTRMVEGSSAGSSLAMAGDRVNYYGSIYPDTAFSFLGFRIASAVPSPCVLVVFLGMLPRRRRR